MGGSPSTSNISAQQAEVRALKARLTASGDLPSLKNVFSRLSQSSPAPPLIPFSTLVAVLSFPPIEMKFGSALACPQLSRLIQCLGTALAETAFDHDKKSVDWIHFLKGYDKICKQSLGTVKLKNLIILLCRMQKLAHSPSELYLVQGAEHFEDLDLEELIAETHVREILSVCWLMMACSALQITGNHAHKGNFLLEVPDLENLVRASMAAGYSNRSVNSMNKQEIDTDGSLKEISVGGLFSWMLAAIPGVSNALTQYVQNRVVRNGLFWKEGSGAQTAFPESRESTTTPNLSDEPIEGLGKSGLLNFGKAWAVGLSMHDQLGAGLVKASVNTSEPLESHITLLYRSSIHGRGMNRFWKQVEGYKGPVLILLAAKSSQVTKEDSSQEAEGGSCWVLGAFSPEGLENQSSYYGSSGCCIFALEPEFHPLHTTGREKCYMYSYKQAPGLGYSSQPKQEGMGFGGGHGKERIWLDVDFLTVTVRHSAVDKTYQPGKLVPDQGYAAVSGQVTEVEVWGLGGSTAEEKQAAYQKRQDVFLEQRRKVDLKAFGNWEESPEKAMLDLVSDPVRVAREDR